MPMYLERRIGMGGKKSAMQEVSDFGFLPRRGGDVPWFVFLLYFNARVRGKLE